MDFKGQTAVLSAIFVLVGMMSLVPAGTEKALGIFATVTGTCGPEGQTHLCNFIPVDKSLSGGSWKQEPWGSLGSGGWETIGMAGLHEVTEKGSVTYKVGGETAVLSFENPIIGFNTCSVSGTGGSCTAGKGWSNPHFIYNLRSDK